MIVVLGSTRQPKAQALAGVLNELREELGPAELRLLDVGSGVPETPLNRADIMAGARNRVEALKKLVPEAQFYVGLEGGLHAQKSDQGSTWTVWLENWAYVSNGKHGFFGSGGSVPVPDAIARETVGRLRSLADVIDELSGKQDVRSGEGTWGVLTNGRVTREEVFRRALLNAFVPFYSNVLRFEI